MSDTILKAKSDELKHLQEQVTKLTEAEERAAADYTEARELLDGLRQSKANDQELREEHKNNPSVMKGFEDFDKMLATGIQLEKDRRLAAEKIASELGQARRDTARLQTEIEQLKTGMEVGGIKDDLGIDFDALTKQGEGIDELLQSTAKTTQAQMESSVAHQASTMDRVQQDIDLCNNLQGKLQTERAALSSGVINRVMNWKKISELDKNLKEVSGKKTDRESMLKEVKSDLDKATRELEAHQKTFGTGAGNGAKVDNVGTQAHINFHGHGEKHDQAKLVKLPNTSQGSYELVKPAGKGHAPR